MFEWAQGLSDEDWAEALAGRDPRTPQMPPAEMQAMFVGSSGAESFREAEAFWRLTKKYLKEGGTPLSRSTRILDIGVGWGRIYRWALREVRPDQITGIDVDQSAVSVCKSAMPYGDFRYVPAGAEYPGAGYDLAFLYSVFSHLSEKTALDVLSSARRALKPGGLLAATTLRLAHIDVWDRQRHDSIFSGYLTLAQFERVEWWERASEGRHLYIPTGGGDVSRPADAYGEAVAPKGWWEKLEGFKLMAFDRPVDLPQAYVVLRRL